MKMHKRMTAVLLSVLAILIFLPVQSFAAGGIDLSHDVSLTISHQYGETHLAGAEFELYFVASVDEFGELSPTETFAQFNVNIQGKHDEAWKTLASTLEGYVLLDQLVPEDSGETDENGLLTFPNQRDSLTPGLYLVIGGRHTQDGKYYDAAPFLVLLPAQDQVVNAWDYDVDVNTKYSAGDLTDTQEPVTQKVLKVWEDEGHEAERPESIEVNLLRNGEVYDTVTLNADNNWRHTWDDLDGSYVWTVAEEKLENYTVEVTQEGITFVVTNTYKTSGTSTPTGSGSSGTSKLPQTGQLWWPVPVLAAVGLLFVVVGLLRRRGAGDAE